MAVTLKELKAAVRATVGTYPSRAACAEAVGVSPQYLSNFLKDPTMRPGPAMLKAFGFRRAVKAYEEAER